ncbi:MAG TPA: hypothetical protein VGK73_08445 [Polyangiaceae bacterium]
MARAGFSPLLFALSLPGCDKGPPPESVRIELPGVVTDRAPVRPVVKERRARESQSVLQGKYSLKAEPAELATTSADGTLSCTKSGDGKVTVEVQGVQAKTELRCRLVDRVEADDLPLLDLSQGAVPLRTRALDKAGHELSEVPISVSSTNPEVATVKDLHVTPLAVGATTLVARASGAEKKLNLRVVKRIDFEAQSLRGGRRVDIALPAGNHEIEVTLKEPKELRIDWRGARRCNYRATATTHRSSCVLEEKGGAVVDNPAFVETGETNIDRARIVVRRIP